MNADGPGTRRASQLMSDAFAAISARDLDRVAQIWDDQTTDSFVPLGIVVTGTTNLRAFFAEMFAALPDLRFVTETVHEVDEQTAVGQWRLLATFSGGPFQGIAPTGRSIDLRGVDVMRFEGAMLRHNDIYYDGLSFVRQVGLLPAADSTADRTMLSGFNALTKAKATVRGRIRR